MEIERVEQFDSGAGRVHRHVRWYVDQRAGVVEHNPNATANQVVGNTLSRIGRNRDDADDDRHLVDDAG